MALATVAELARAERIMVRIWSASKSRQNDVEIVAQELAAYREVLNEAKERRSGEGGQSQGGGRREEEAQAAQTRSQAGEDEVSKKHPGFAKVQQKIEKEGYSKEEAGAILANKTRNASKKAKAANPRLNKVKGGK